MSNSRMMTAFLVGFGVGLHGHDPVREVAQEEIATLAADVGGRRHHLPWQLALHRGRILVDALGNLVLVRVGARLIGAVVRVVDEVRAQQRRIDRDTAPPRDCRADAVALDRLNLVFGLARADEDAEAAAKDRPPVARRPGHRHPRLEVVRLAAVERRALSASACPCRCRTAPRCRRPPSAACSTRSEARSSASRHLPASIRPARSQSCSPARPCARRSRRC